MIKLLSGDCREVLATLPADSVHCVVTSPPYFALRSYLHAEHPDKHREIGSEPTPDEYLATMVAVFREVRRVLRPDGTPERSTLTGGGGRYREGSKVEAMFNEQAPTKRASNGAGVKPKDLLMMPARLALALQADGWWVRSEITWCKPSPMPESCTDRPTSATEKVYLLTKRANYFYDAIAIREAAVSDHPSGNGYKRNPRLSYSDDHGARGNDEPWEGVGGTRNARNWWVINSKPFPQAHFATYPPELAERCIRAGTSQAGCCAQCGKPWVRIATKTYEPTDRTPAPNKGHLGAFGERAANMTRDGFVPNRDPVITTTGWSPGCKCEMRCQRMGCRSSGSAPLLVYGVCPKCGTQQGIAPATVLDPFAGAGTTLLVADRLQRDAIGIELNVDYTTMAMDRVRADAPLFADLGPVPEHPEETQIADLFREAAD